MPEKTEHPTNEQPPEETLKEGWQHLEKSFIPHADSFFQRYDNIPSADSIFKGVEQANKDLENLAKNLMPELHSDDDSNKDPEEVKLVNQKIAIEGILHLGHDSPERLKEAIDLVRDAPNRLERIKSDLEHIHDLVKGQTTLQEMEPLHRFGEISSPQFEKLRSLETQMKNLTEADREAFSKAIEKELEKYDSPNIQTQMKSFQTDMLTIEENGQKKYIKKWERGEEKEKDIVDKDACIESFMRKVLQHNSYLDILRKKALKIRDELDRQLQEEKDRMTGKNFNSHYKKAA